MFIELSTPKGKIVVNREKIISITAHPTNKDLKILNLETST